MEGNLFGLRLYNLQVLVRSVVRKNKKKACCTYSSAWIVHVLQTRYSMTPHAVPHGCHGLVWTVFDHPSHDWHRGRHSTPAPIAVGASPMEKVGGRVLKLLDFMVPPRDCAPRVAALAV